MSPEPQPEGKQRYDSCEAQGAFIPLGSIEIDQIKTMHYLATIDFGAAREWAGKTAADSPRWNSLFKLYYDSLHQYSEAFIRFDAIKARTHECVFAYLWTKHPELGLDFAFLEMVRKKRNRSIYYGEAFTFEDWKVIGATLEKNIETLKTALETKIGEHGLSRTSQ